MKKTLTPEQEQIIKAMAQARQEWDDADAFSNAQREAGRKLTREALKMAETFSRAEKEAYVEVRATEGIAESVEAVLLRFGFIS
jgi:hypothetical protein